MKIVVILFVLAFTILLSFLQGLQAKDRKLNSTKTDTKLKSLWHKIQGAVHVLLASSVFVFYIPDWFTAIFGFFMTLSVIWLVFDLVNNIITGNKPFHKGDNFTDKLLSKIPISLELIIKLILVVVTITYFITNPFN